MKSKILLLLVSLALAGCSSAVKRVETTISAILPQGDFAQIQVMSGGSSFTLTNAHNHNGTLTYDGATIVALTPYGLTTFNATPMAAAATPK